MSKGLFDSFNARAVEPEKVGLGFIYNAIFRDLISNNNSVIIGPRGSGKTTYFKMLTLPALLNWRGQQRNKVVSKIDFIAIYVPTDFSWFPDFRHPVGLLVNPDIDRVLSYARFRNSVLREAVKTIQFASSPNIANDPILNKFYISLDDSSEELLARRLALSWDLELDFSGFDGLIHAINKKNRNIQRLLAASYYNPETAMEKIANTESLHDQIFDDLVAFADCVDAISNRSQTWAVCFDEVEIAPDSIKQEIWSSLRSTDQRFKVKLSASPYDESLWRKQGPNDPMKDNDYKETWLSLDRNAALKFSEKILSGICSELNISSERQQILLGSSYYDDDFDLSLAMNKSNIIKHKKSLSKNKNRTFAKNGFYVKKFESLASKDTSFREFLEKSKINMEEFSNISGNRRAFIRKFISSVVIRDAYYRDFSENSAPHIKSKKAIDRFFTGKTTIFTICEGNPRWLLVVLRPMLEKYVEAREHPSQPISRELQAKCLEDGVTTLLSILSTISGEGKSTKNGPTLIEIIERTGDYFFEEVLGKFFVPEPTLSFIVDDAVDEKTLNYIGAALNQGALMLAPEPRNPRAIEIQDRRSLYGQRLRLSYYLAPRYRLPLVLGRAKNLSAVLANRSETSSNEEQIMFDLFGDLQ